MNEPKRRGRPPKKLPPETVQLLKCFENEARFEARLDAYGGVLPSREEVEAKYAAWDSAIERGESPTGLIGFSEADRLAKAKYDREDEERKAAQAYALRVWNGQSRDVPRNERLRRVKLALEGQGLSMEGVEL